MLFFSSVIGLTAMCGANGLKPISSGSPLSTLNIYSILVKKVSDEPFILASQAMQVFYVLEHAGSEWVSVH